MGIFILRCLSNQNTQHSEHVDLTVSIHKYFKPFKHNSQTGLNFLSCCENQAGITHCFGCFVACTVACLTYSVWLKVFGYFSEVHVQCNCVFWVGIVVIKTEFECVTKQLK